MVLSKALKKKIKTVHACRTSYQMSFSINVIIIVSWLYIAKFARHIYMYYGGTSTQAQTSVPWTLGTTIIALLCDDMHNLEDHKKIQH